MDPGLAAVLGTAITGLTTIVVALIGAWSSKEKAELAATIREQKATIKALGGEPDDD